MPIPKFGIGQITEKTPKWANWIFSITFLLSTALSIWVVSTSFVETSIRLEVVLDLKVFETLVFGVSQMFGVKIDPDTE